MNNKVLKKYIIEVLIISVLVVIDLLCKLFLFNQDSSIIPSVLGIRSVGHLNTGGAWGFLGDNLWLLILFTLAFLLVIIFVEIRFKICHPMFIVSLSLVLGGTLGNLADRIFLGGVRDFLYFEFWPTYPTFNFADVFLVIGMFLLAVFVLFVMKTDVSKEPK